MLSASLLFRRGLKTAKRLPKRRSKEMKIAIEGCCHGELDAIYGHIAQLEQRNKYKVDLLLVCGDFEAIRNNQDLQCMAVPEKYRHLGGFHRYYTGEKKAPMLTIVIGGNHEASNYMWELYHGGWLAPNMYFLGFAGCVQVNGIRIAGVSGIYNSNHYNLGHYEHIPFDKGQMRSIYHTREYEMYRLSQLSSPDIFLSHDWPVGIEKYGDKQGLLQRKPFFRKDLETGQLGSPPLMQLMHKLRPRWWFSAHMHCRFEARVVHSPKLAPVVAPVAGDNPDEIVIDDLDDIDPSVEQAGAEKVAVDASQRLPLGDKGKAPETNPDEIILDDEMDAVEVPPPLPRSAANPDEIILDDEMDTVVVPPPPQSSTTFLALGEMSSEDLKEGVAGPSASGAGSATTQFLALDKCLPRRQFLEVIDVPTRFGDPASPRLTFDPEWLAITRAFHPYLSVTRAQPRLPEPEQAQEMVRKELDWVLTNVSLAEKQSGGKKAAGAGSKDVSDCQVFWPTAPGPGKEGGAKFKQPPWYTNPQTVAFCKMLELENKINPVPKGMELPPVQLAAGKATIATTSA